MRCDEAQELITGLIDAELSATERVAVDGHLAECRDCKTQFEREAALKRDMKLAAAAIVVPHALRQKMEGRGSTLVWDISPPQDSSVRRWLAASRWRPVYAAAVVALVIAGLLFQVRAKKDVATAALPIHESIVSGKTTLVRVNDAARLRKELSLAVANRFAPIPLDLSPLKLYPVAGFVQKLGGRDVLVSIYEGSGPMITCFTFLGDDSDAPKDAESLFDPEKKINFYLFSRGAMSAVMHRVGEVNCLLVSNMPPADLLVVARGKPHHA
jgi:anti-sigma factor RsiW